MSNTINPELAGVDTAALAWRKATASNPSGNCLQFAELGNGLVAIRNSRRPEEVITANGGERDAFLKGAKAGEFDA